MKTEHPACRAASFRLNLQMVADQIEDRNWKYYLYLPGELPALTKCLIYHEQQTLYKDTLYIIPEGTEDTFPADQFSYITTTALSGEASHIRGVKCSFPELVNYVMEIFSHYSSFERELSHIISTGGSLGDLCCAASSFFGNPIYVHDNLFCVIGHSSGLDTMFEFSEKTKKTHIPLWLINEYKFDASYRHTFSRHHADIWRNELNDSNVRSLYVNLWDSGAYLGRLVIEERESAIRPGQFQAAEIFTGYVLLWMKQQILSSQQIHHSYEQLFIDLLTEGTADEQALATILSILNWKQEDRYLCLKLQSQDTADIVRPDFAINSRLSAILSGHISFRYQGKLCVILNLSLSGMNPGELRLRLAPLIRDNCLYAGISNPVDSIHALRLGFIQADLALDYITGTDSSDWMVLFSSCALNYIRQSACRKLPARMVAHPILLDLLEHDRAQGTQYYSTLRVYLLCERNIPATAAALIIHRTTLTYRLGKIAELTHLNLDNDNLRLYLLISFQLLEQEVRMDLRQN